MQFNEFMIYCRKSLITYYLPSAKGCQNSLVLQRLLIYRIGPGLTFAYRGSYYNFTLNILNIWIAALN